MANKECSMEKSFLFSQVCLRCSSSWFPKSSALGSQCTAWCPGCPTRNQAAGNTPLLSSAAKTTFGPWSDEQYFFPTERRNHTPTTLTLVHRKACKSKLVLFHPEWIWWIMDSSCLPMWNLTPTQLGQRHLSPAAGPGWPSPPRLLAHQPGALPWLSSMILFLACFYSRQSGLHKNKTKPWKQ